MIIMLLFGFKTIYQSIFFSFLGILALILVYEFGVLFLNKKSALIATTLMAFSPMAIAHSRVAYHTTPIPLLTIIYLFSLMYLWQRKKHSLILSVFSWAILMQFELSLLALGLLIPYVIYRKKITINSSSIIKIILGLILGFIPQLIHDLTNPITKNQLVGFAAWTGYRILSAFGLFPSNNLSPTRLGNTLSIYWAYWQKMYGLNNPILAGSLAFFLLFAFVILLKNIKKIKPGLEIVLVAFLLLSASYFVHQTPSEAYFPPFFVLFNLLLSWGIIHFFKRSQYILIIFLLGWSITNINQVLGHNFFVSTPQEYNYGPSVAEQRQILNIINIISPQKFSLSSTADASKFPSYFDNFRWLAQEKNLKYSNKARVFYIERKNSPLSGYPGLTKIEFQSLDVYFK
jgi:4-amino-4-deoxy-L-arabinose transferase-like glycosyltransferase